MWNMNDKRGHTLYWKLSCALSMDPQYSFPSLDSHRTATNQTNFLDKKHFSDKKTKKQRKTDTKLGSGIYIFQSHAMKQGHQRKYGEGKKRYPLASKEIHNFDRCLINRTPISRNMRLDPFQSNIQHLLFFSFLSQVHFLRIEFETTDSCALSQRTTFKEIIGTNLGKCFANFTFQTFTSHANHKKYILAIHNYDIGDITNIWWQQIGFKVTQHPKYMLKPVNTLSGKTQSVKFIC